jgi:hypothetical protein
MPMSLLPVLYRHNLGSKVTTVVNWTGHQHWMLTDPGFFSRRELRKVCEALVIQWNRQQPGTWKYWISV